MACNKVLKQTVEQPSIKWSCNDDTNRKRSPPVEVHLPLRNFPVSCIMAGKRHRESWENGTLFFSPGQNYVPLVLMDSMGKYFVRYPNAIHVIRCGATADHIAKWAKDNLVAIAKKVPLPLFLIISAGGNDLTAHNIRQGTSAALLADRVINAWSTLEEWCSSHGIKVMFSHVIPRPSEQDPNKSLNERSVRWFLSDAFCFVNDWIEDLNKKKGDSQLLLNKYVEHSDVVQKKGRHKRIKKRTYDKTSQRRIRLNFFAQDWIHLNSKGIEEVQEALHTYISKNI